MFADVSPWRIEAHVFELRRVRDVARCSHDVEPGSACADRACKAGYSMSGPNHKATLVRRVGLVEKTRQPAPLSYRIEPVNRRQRRQLARLQQRQAVKGK